MHNEFTAITGEVQRRLTSIEQEHDVRILYACESGSRAWGFDSTDSDYDVRFIYARPKDWYLSIDLESKRDVIETPVDQTWDINGWDMRKALQLYRKSNPPLYEWLFSPIVYLQFTSFADRLRELAAEFYNLTSARYHYLSMARNNLRAYLRGPEVVRKKYFYALRPLLAVLWVEKGLGVVPTEFSTLVAGVVTDHELQEEISDLLRLKKQGNELDRGAPCPAIQRFIESEVDRQTRLLAAFPKPEYDAEELNRLFRYTLEE